LAIQVQPKKKPLESELLVYLQITLQIKPFPKEMFSNSVGLSKKKMLGEFKLGTPISPAHSIFINVTVWICP
jgi:hypothetical protein